MATDYIQQLYLYQAANSDPVSVRANFVVRVYEFETILADLLRKNAQDPVQHELLLGRRGSGKSSLLRRIEVEIDTNETLREKYIAINLPEEQTNVNRLFDLWEEVLKEIAEKLQIAVPEVDFEACANDHDYTHQLYAQIHAILQQAGKKAVILLDNFDRILENFDKDAHLLRETLLNYNDLKIIGGSTRMNEHFWRYDKPFYEFFRVFRLEALSREEIEMLLKHWSEVLNLPQLEAFVAQHPGKLETIRILTDGLPRTLQFFIRILIHHTDLQGYDYLRKIMDETTPLYQERLNTLPAAHRKILAQMAFFWEACSTKQLAEACKIESKLISANLKQLNQKGLIETLATNNRNKLYRIAERFFNMWFIVTQGNPSQKRRARWLSIFLETWYDAHELQQLTKSYLDNLRDGTMPFDLALVRTKALAQLKAITVDERDEMIELTRQMGEIAPQNYLQFPPKFSEIRNQIRKFADEKNWKNAFEKAEEIEQEGEGWNSFYLAYVYDCKNDFGKAENYYLQAIEKGHVSALNNLANLYTDQGKVDLAEQYYLQAIEKGDVNALYNFALLYYREGIKKANSLALIKQRNQKKATDSSFALEITISVWNGEMKGIKAKLWEWLAENKAGDLVDTLIKELLIHHQTQLVYELFESEEFGVYLKDKYVVLYYATQKLLTQAPENIDLIIPPELQNTVAEVIAAIKERQAFYYGK